ncbi:HlyD family efflux transporter periplasmic adaptor subunit [Emticicia sp. CRIBPO]|uniref:efflux RND transporter periplasmic adaptor subunit n=1 Tax=Emticicia sp. CRIBPO TaxID=2683258 RepID=UPI001412D8AC|nr:efflux RND transporter periplasmic adaptor subunit [Emticicia sp. CRIBPO]NBA85832.1 HlyD family efflux transporter periplasmic adaptor subunit [Emticicia sp. CRIBPO]
MDRELSQYTINRKKIKNIAVGLAGVALLAGGIYYFRNSLQSSVESSKIRVAVVETGNVENTLTATGEVIPAFEQVITSPIRASIKQVFFTPGSQVKTGQPIVSLDKSLTLIELEKLKDQLALKLNSVDKLKMDLDKKIYDADINDRIKSLTINRLKAELEDIKRLQKVGGRTQEDVTKAENNLKIAEYEKAQLENELAYNRKSVGANVRESQLNAQIESKNLKEMEHKLKMADIVADRSGVLTWVNDKIGTAVNEGEMLARLADLGSFRIEGSCSDVYADQLKVGLPVIVRINETDLRGMVTQIKPSVENGIMQFSVQLDDNRNAALRPNMKVEVFIVTKRVEKAVRVMNGPAFNGKRKTYVFVLENGVGKRREVETGLSSFDFVEIKSGLQPGEKVIVSDLSQFEHLNEIRINQK